VGGSGAGRRFTLGGALISFAMPPRAPSSTATAPRRTPTVLDAVETTNGTSSARPQRTKPVVRGDAAEEHGETVAQLILEAGEARVGELARLMGVSQVTVSKTVARLVERRLVNAPAYKPITLTPAGRKLAERAAERHLVVLAFLRKLGVREEQAQIDAGIIENQVSGATIAAMQRWLDGSVSRGGREQNGN